MRHTVDEYAQCPFYKWHDGSVLCCEGVEGCESLHNCFVDAAELKYYKKKYCRGCWEQCPVAKMLEEKYENC